MHHPVEPANSPTACGRGLALDGGFDPRAGRSGGESRRPVGDRGASAGAGAWAGAGGAFGGWTPAEEGRERRRVRRLCRVRLAEAIARARRLRPAAWVGDFTVAGRIDWRAESPWPRDPGDRSVPLDPNEIGPPVAA